MLPTKPAAVDYSMAETWKARDKYVEEEVDSKLLSFQTNGIVQIDEGGLETHRVSVGVRDATAKTSSSDVELPNDLLRGASRLRKNDMKTHRSSGGRRQRLKNATIRQMTAGREASPQSTDAKNSTAENGTVMERYTFIYIVIDVSARSHLAADSGA